MASIRKVSGNYYARFYDRNQQPKRKTVPLRTSRKDVARRRLTRMERRFENGNFDPWNPDDSAERLSVVEAVERFLEARSHLRPYVHASHLTRASQRKRYRHLRAFLNWSAQNGHVERSPLDDVRQPKKQKKQAAFLTTEDVEKLLRCISAHYEVTENAVGQKPDDEWLSAMIRVGVSTGIRRLALCRLRWADVNLRERLLTVRSREGEETKSGHERQLPLRGDALDVLHALNEGGATGEAFVFTDRGGDPIKPDRATKRFKFHVRKAKLADRERLSFHSLRHTAGSWLAMRGVPMRVIQAILGHSSVSVTERYSHLQPEVMGAAMEEAFGDTSFGGHSFDV